MLQTGEFKAKPKVDTLQELRKELQEIRLQLDTAKRKVESLQLLDADNHKLISELREQTNVARATASAGTIDISGLATLVARGFETGLPRVQWRITTSPGCGPCRTFISQLRSRLVDSIVDPTKRWDIGEHESAQVRITHISEAEWARTGWTLPRIELCVDGIPISTYTGSSINADQMADRFNAEMQNLRPLPAQSNVVGMRVGTLPIKPQVIQVLAALTPFLNGGTLNLTYTPKPGVIKDYLTLTQGNVGIRVPAKTSFNVICNDRELALKFIQPTVQAKIPIRGNTDIKGMTLTPDKLSLQLSWMVDADVSITDPSHKTADGEYYLPLKRDCIEFPLVAKRGF